MADVSFFPSFTYKWAQTGQLVSMDDTQYKLGWAYIGTTHPSVEQFNKVFQIADEKSNFLYRQIKNAVESKGLSMSANNDLSLRDALNAMMPIGMPLPWPNANPPAGFILMSGQSINASQYPVLFGLYGATLPDLRERFIRGASPSISPLTLQEDTIKSHKHEATTASAGSHNHSGTTANGGTHNHSASTGGAGDHVHGGLGQAGFDVQGDGSSGTARMNYGDNWPYNGNILNMWAGNHAHSVSVDNAGNHNHSLSINSAGAHIHEVTVNETGSTETRPKAIAFYYVCRAG